MIHEDSENDKMLGNVRYLLSFGAFPTNHGSGGGFSLYACEDFGRMFDSSFPACAFLLLFFFFF